MRNVYINAFVRESSEQDGPNFSKASSIERNAPVNINPRTPSLGT